MPDDPIIDSFSYPAAPGGNWPPIMGATSDEEAGGSGGGAVVLNTGVNYVVIYMWGVN